MDFLMVIMVSDIAHERICTMVATPATKLPKMMAILQLIG